MKCLGFKNILRFMLITLFVISFSIQAHAVTLEFWTNETTEERLTVIREIIEDFGAGHPGISIRVVSVHESDLPQRLSATIAARRLPQIIQMGAEHVMRLGREGLLDSNVAESVIDSIGRDDFFAGPLRMTTTGDDRNVAVPMHGWVQGIWYRTDWFEEAGLEAPTNWDAIMKAAQHFYNPQQRKYGISIGTRRDHFANQSFNQFAFANEAYMFDKDGNIQFNTPEMIETIAYYKELASYGAPGPQSYREGRAMYMSDQLAMIMYSSFLMGTLANNAPHLIDSTAFANVMSHKGEATYGQVVSLGVPVTATAQQKEAAQAFLTYLMQGENYIKYLHMAPGGMLPVRASIAGDERYRDNELLGLFGEQIEDIVSGLENAQAFGFEHGQVFPQVGEIASRFVIGDGFARMIDQNLSAEETAQWIHDRMISILR